MAKGRNWSKSRKQTAILQNGYQHKSNRYGKDGYRNPHLPLEREREEMTRDEIVALLAREIASLLRAHGVRFG